MSGERGAKIFFRCVNMVYLQLSPRIIPLCSVPYSHSYVLRQSATHSPRPQDSLDNFALYHSRFSLGNHPRIHVYDKQGEFPADLSRPLCSRLRGIHVGHGQRTRHRDRGKLRAGIVCRRGNSNIALKRRQPVHLSVSPVPGMASSPVPTIPFMWRGTTSLLQPYIRSILPRR